MTLLIRVFHLLPKGTNMKKIVCILLFLLLYHIMLYP